LLEIVRVGEQLLEDDLLMHILIVLVDFSKEGCQGLQTAMLGFKV
jgi:hypothetical protein